MVQRPRIMILLALFVALSLRVLVPAGWMPVHGEGAFAIEPCPSAEGTMVMNGASADHRHDASHKDQHSSDCSFSPFHAGFAHAADAPCLLVASRGTAPRTVAVATRIFARGPPALPPPSTGPPALA